MLQWWETDLLVLLTEGKALLSLKCRFSNYTYKNKLI